MKGFQSFPEDVLRQVVDMADNIDTMRLTCKTFKEWVEPGYQAAKSHESARVGYIERANQRNKVKVGRLS